MKSNAYAYHRPSAAAEKTIRDLREAFARLHLLIETVPDGEPRTQSLLRLKEASMWATNAVIVADIESIPLP